MTAINEEEIVTLAPECHVWGEDTVLTDKDEIAYYKVRTKQLILSNRLLGQVDDEGNYYIPEKLRRQLAKMEKEVLEASETRYYAESYYFGRTFNFSIEVTNDDGLVATLYLTERVEGHPTLTILKTFIARLVLGDNVAMSERIYKTFRLTDNPSLTEDDFTELADFLNDQAELDEMYGEIGEIGSQIYIMRTIALLKNAGAKGQKALAEFLREAKEQGLLDEEDEKILLGEENGAEQKTDDKQPKTQAKKKGNFAAQHKLLDKVLKQEGGLEILSADKEQAMSPRKEYTEAMGQVAQAQAKKQEGAVRVDSKPNASKPTAKANAKKAPAKAPAKKATKAASKPAKKDAPKADKKKDDKKDEKKPLNNYASEVVSTSKSLGTDKKTDSKPAEQKETKTPTPPSKDEGKGEKEKDASVDVMTQFLRRRAVIAEESPQLIRKQEKILEKNDAETYKLSPSFEDVTGTTLLDAARLLEDVNKSNSIHVEDEFEG